MLIVMLSPTLSMMDVMFVYVARKISHRGWIEDSLVPTIEVSAIPAWMRSLLLAPSIPTHSDIAQY